MPVRYCPKCNSELRYSDHYFCSSCGFALTGELVNPKIDLKSKVVRPTFVTNKLYGRIHEISNKTASHIFNKANIKYYAASLFLLFIGVFLGRITSLFYDQISLDISKPRVNEIKAPTKNTIKTDLPLGFGNLTSSEIMNFIPSKLDGLFVVYDSQQFLILLRDNLNIDDKSLEAVTLLMSGNAAGYVYEEGWAIIVPVTNTELSQVLLNTYKIENVKTAFVENHLIIASNELSLERTKSVKNKEELNFKQTPEYVNLKGKLQPGGKILVITFNENGIKSLRSLTEAIKDKKFHNALDEAEASGFKEFILE